MIKNTIILFFLFQRTIQLSTRRHNPLIDRTEQTINLQYFRNEGTRPENSARRRKCPGRREAEEGYRGSNTTDARPQFLLLDASPNFGAREGLRTQWPSNQQWQAWQAIGPGQRWSRDGVTKASAIWSQRATTINGTGGKNKENGERCSQQRIRLQAAAAPFPMLPRLPLLFSWHHRPPTRRCRHPILSHCERRHHGGSRGGVKTRVKMKFSK